MKCRIKCKKKKSNHKSSGWQRTHLLPFRLDNKYRPESFHFDMWNLQYVRGRRGNKSIRNVLLRLVFDGPRFQWFIYSTCAWFGQLIRLAAENQHLFVFVFPICILVIPIWFFSRPNTFGPLVRVCVCVMRLDISILNFIRDLYIFISDWLAASNWISAGWWSERMWTRQVPVAHGFRINIAHKVLYAAHVTTIDNDFFSLLLLFCGLCFFTLHKFMNFIFKWIFTRLTDIIGWLAAARRFIYLFFLLRFSFFQFFLLHL